MTDPNDAVPEEVEHYLEQRSVELDPLTRKQLDGMRRQAVAIAQQEIQRTEGRGGKPWLVNAGYAAAFSLAVIAGVVVLKAQPTPEVDPAAALELVLLNDDFEMLEEDLAFYDWMETELGNRG